MADEEPLSAEHLKSIEEEPAATTTNDKKMQDAKMQDEEALVPPKKKRSRKCICFWCCGISLAILIILIVIILILIFTVFKVHQPTIAVTSATLQGVSFSIPIFTAPITITANLNTNVTVHNPNAAGFKYQNTTAEVYYDGQQIALAQVPAGEIGAHGTEKIYLPLSITLSSSDINGNLTQDLLVSRMFPLVSKVNVKGDVKIWFVSINNVKVSSTCDVDYFLNNQTQSYDCSESTKL